MKELILKIIEEGTSIEFRPHDVGITVHFRKKLPGARMARNDLTFSKEVMYSENFLEQEIEYVYNQFKTFIDENK